MSELQLLHWIRFRLQSSSVGMDLTDDCGAMLWKDPQLLVSTDLLLDGVHFDLKTMDPHAIGRKCLAVNLSDLAASAGEPRAFTLSLALERGLEPEKVFALLDGLIELAEAFEVKLIGGDTNFWSKPSAINVTIFGSPDEQGPITRQGAKVGDAIFVSGKLGGSLSGHHLHFMPRIRESRFLAQRFRPHAMIDLSDGLATDLRHLCEQSQLAAELDADRIPIATHLSTALGPPEALMRAFCDGEDFELCFAISEELAESLQLSWEGAFPAVPLTRIGRCAEGQGLFFREGDVRREILWRGYEHV